MTNLEIINELDSVIFMADQLKTKALQVRKKLESEMVSVSPKGQKAAISESVMKRMAKRQMSIQEINA